MKKIKVIAGISLIAQAMLFFILFLVYWNKSKSLAKTLAVFSSVGGICGALLVLSELNDRKWKKRLDNELQTFDRDFEEIFGPDEPNCSFGND